MSEGRCKVRFQLASYPLDESLEWPPYEAESMWGEWTGPNTARLISNPFYAKDVGYLDEVRVKKAEVLPDLEEDNVDPNFVEFDSVVNRSGHGIVRIILFADEVRDQAEQAVADIEKMGCTWESTGDGLVSIDIPPEANQRQVMSRLQVAAALKGIYVDVGFLAQGPR